MRASINRAPWSAPLIACAALLLGGCPITPSGTGAQVPDTAQDAEDVAGTLAAPLRVLPLEGAVENENLVILSWTTVAGADEYDIFLGPDSNPPLIGSVTDTVFLVRDLPPCTDHYWRVAAISGDRVISTAVFRFSTRCDD
jgi:hypothetical protein